SARAEPPPTRAERGRERHDDGDRGEDWSAAKSPGADWLAGRWGRLVVGRSQGRQFGGLRWGHVRFGRQRGLEAIAPPLHGFDQMLILVLQRAAKLGNALEHRII